MALEYPYPVIQNLGWYNYAGDKVISAKSRKAYEWDHKRGKYVEIVSPLPWEARPPIFSKISTRGNRGIQDLYDSASQAASLGRPAYRWDSAEYRESVELFKREFEARLALMLKDKPVAWCHSCGSICFQHLATRADGFWFCRGACTNRNTAECIQCKERHMRRNPGYQANMYHYRIGGEMLDNPHMICGTCLNKQPTPTMCAGCQYYTSKDNLEEVGPFGRVCQYCRERNYMFCEVCNAWAERRGHIHQCVCSPHPKKFNFKTALGVIHNDKPTKISLPAGHIDTVGIAEIKGIVQQYVGSTVAVDKVEPKWVVAFGGAYTKRLAKELFKSHGWKASSAMLEQVGTIAQAHTAKEHDYVVEFTRELNQGPEYFCNPSSCWWQSYSWSRCSFKAGGGIGVRFFDHDKSKAPNARIWMLPLNDKLKPIPDPDAPAYFLFNQYGRISAVEMARTIATITSKSYRKIRVVDSQFVLEINSETGYLIADQAVCTKTAEISFNYPMTCRIRRPR